VGVGNYFDFENGSKYNGMGEERMLNENKKGENKG
jgi:hypothetical protein